MKLDSEQKRVLKAGLPASLGAVLGTIVGMLVQGKLDSWKEALVGIGVGLLFALLFCVFYVLGSKIPKKNDDSAKEETQLSSKCSYRSIAGTHTSNNTPKTPVPVPLMDLYGHLTFTENPPALTLFQLFVYLCVVGLFEE